MTVAQLTSTLNTWIDPHPRLENISPMDHLYNRLDGMYPNRWRANFNGENAIQAWRESWAEAFDEDGFTFTDIRTGIKNCRRMFDWPPSLTEFQRACRPSLDPETAFHEAVQGLVARRKGETGEWSHPAVYHAAVAAGQHDMLNSTYSALKSRWGKALADQLDKREWGPIPVAHVALPEPKKTELTNEEAAKAMDRMGAGDVLRNGRDPKAWAQKVLDSQNGKSPTVIAMARRALDGVAA